MSSQSEILLNKIISTVVKSGASRLHLEIGSKPIIRVGQKLVGLADDNVITKELLDDIIKIVLLPESQKNLVNNKSVIITRSFEGGMRFKIHIFYQKNNLAAIFTYIPNTIIDISETGLTPELIDVIKSKNGLLAIGGYHGSGRTTTVFSLLNHINKNQSKYILTIEKPIEYILTPSKSLVEQREVGRDANNFLSALKFSKDSDVDIVFLSEINSYEVLLSAFDLIASGRLVIITAEANSAAEVIAKLIAIAPEEESHKIRHILADVLLGVVVQQLIPRRGGGQVIATEILISNSSSQTLIREGRYSQITSVIQTSGEEGMISLDRSLIEFVKTGEVDYEDALEVAVNKADFKAAAQKFRNIK